MMWRRLFVGDGMIPSLSYVVHMMRSPYGMDAVRNETPQRGHCQHPRPRRLIWGRGGLVGVRSISWAALGQHVCMRSATKDGR